jgi:hypothetical protein
MPILARTCRREEAKERAGRAFLRLLVLSSGAVLPKMTIFAAVEEEEYPGRKPLRRRCENATR